METTTVKPIEAHVISHTHWDREWYRPFQNFRYYLVKVIDQTLDMLANDPEYRYFHMDGQTVVLEDYAQIRPERVEELKQRIREGRFIIGPWYDLADLFLVDGESLLRNMQLGIRLCRDWGGNPMQLGYTVDLFGHNSQMPQIFSGFGIHTATLFRGVNRQAAGSEFIWESPDGTECLVIRLCDHKAYSNFWYTFYKIMTQRSPYDEEEVRKGIDELITETTEQAATPYLLFLDGVDHATANPLTTRIIRDANRFRADIRIIHSSWEEYIKKVRAYLDEHKPELKRLKGELRITNKDGRLNRLTTDVSSSRIYLKIANKQSEIALLRWLEPMQAIASAYEAEIPSGFLLQAWKYLLKNHPHDSICGCSVDQVHRDMEYRFDQVLSITGEAIPELLSNLSGLADTSCAAEGETPLVVFNPSQYPRSGIMRLRFESSDPNPPENFALFTADGHDIPFQMIEKRKLKNRIGYTPIACASHSAGATEYDLIADMQGLPGLGYSVIRMRNNVYPPDAGKVMVSNGYGIMENEHLKVTFDEKGQVDILHKETGVCYRGLHNFEDCGEVGDLWVHKTPTTDTLVRGVKQAELSILRNGPLLATWRVRYTIELPECAAPDNSRRSERVAEQVVISDFTLTRTSCFLKVETLIRNQIKDHRLRVTLPTGIQTDINHASSQFDVVQRDIKLQDLRDWSEPESEIKPTQGFIDVNDGLKGLALITFGLPEYAVIDDEPRTIALTLIRALGNTVGTEGEDGPQMFRDIRFNYAILPHAGGWEAAGLYHRMDEHNLALKTVVAAPHSGALPSSQSFVDIEPEDLIFSSLRNPYEDQRAAVLRVYNPTDKPVSGRIAFGLPVEECVECDLNDAPGAMLRTAGNSAIVEVGPKKICSLRVRFE